MLHVFREPQGCFCFKHSGRTGINIIQCNLSAQTSFSLSMNLAGSPFPSSWICHLCMFHNSDSPGLLGAVWVIVGSRKNARVGLVLNNRLGLPVLTRTISFAFLQQSQFRFSQLINPTHSYIASIPSSNDFLRIWSLWFGD